MSWPKNRFPKIKCWNDGRGSAWDCIYINKRRHVLGRVGSEASQEKYHRIVAEWIASGRSASYGVRAHETTVGELLDDYVRHCEGYYGTDGNSEWHRVKLVAERIRALYGSHPAKEFGPLQFKAFRQVLIDAALSRSYINSSMKRLLRCFRWGAAESRISPEIPQALTMVPGLKRGRTIAPECSPVGPIDDATIDATLPHLSDVVADMVRFQRLTGCRPGEVCILRPQDVDRSDEIWVYRPARHKTQYIGRARTIAIGPKAQAILLRYLVRSSDAYCFSPKDSLRWQLERRQICYKENRTTPIYPSELRAREKAKLARRKGKGRRVGEQYDTKSYFRAIRYGCKKAGIEPWAPNRLRHSAATSIRKQFGLEAAQVVLGHSQANVTQVYAERDFSLAASVAKQVG